MQLRQGDVFLTTTTERPTDVPVTPERDDLLVLAHGEATGHVHAISARHADMYSNDLGFLLLVSEETQLRHGNPDKDWSGDHADVTVPPGRYQVTIDREYRPSGWSTVVD